MHCTHRDMFQVYKKLYANSPTNALELCVLVKDADQRNTRWSFASMASVISPTSAEALELCDGSRRRRNRRPTEIGALRCVSVSHNRARVATERRWIFFVHKLEGQRPILERLVHSTPGRQQGCLR